MIPTFKINLFNKIKSKLFSKPSEEQVAHLLVLQIYKLDNKYELAKLYFNYKNQNSFISSKIIEELKNIHPEEYYKNLVNEFKLDRK